MHDPDVLAQRLGFKTGVVNDLLHHIFQHYSFSRNALRAALEASQSKQLANQFIQALRLLLNAVQRSFRGRGTALARKFQRHAQTRQWRAQFVRNICQQTFLGINQG